MPRLLLSFAIAFAGIAATVAIAVRLNSPLCFGWAIVATIFYGLFFLYEIRRAKRIATIAKYVAIEKRDRGGSGART